MEYLLYRLLKLLAIHLTTLCQYCDSYLDYIQHSSAPAHYTHLPTPTST
jgi:hypothetical protein